MINPTTRQLVIVGMGGFGREVWWLAKRAGIPIRGFLDDHPTTAGIDAAQSPLLGGLRAHRMHKDAQFVIAIGNPNVRRACVQTMDEDTHFATLIDPGAIIDLGQTRLGPGSILCAGAVATVNITLGAHCIVNLGATLGHDTTLGDFCTIAPLAAISGGVWMEQEVEVGTGAAIRQNVRLGYNSMVGMGAVLLGDTEPHGVYVGNPAKLMKHKLPR